MKKFFILFKKEIQELLTLRMLLPVIILVILFSSLGQLVSSEVSKFSEPWSLTVLDQSRSDISRQLIAFFSEDGIHVHSPTQMTSDEAIPFARENGSAALLVIPEDFDERFQEDTKVSVSLYSFMKGFSIFSNAGGSRISELSETINDFLSNKRLTARLGDANPELFKNPVAVDHFTVLQERKAPVELGRVMVFIQSQTILVPVILFLVIVMAAQMVATGIASEKENKTLEILLSSPVSRHTIIFSKILAAGIVGLLFSVLYMLGWWAYIGSLSGGTTLTTDSSFAEALEMLGITINPYGYFLLGLSLFLSILTALAIAITLGILAEDVKSVQTVTTPLMILIMIPYFLTLFLDIHSAAPLVRFLVYAIPFSHTFLAMHNIMGQDYIPVFYGILYQAFIAIFFIVLASKIFTSDKILTLKLKWKK